jgi:hypothetical protein
MRRRLAVALTMAAVLGLAGPGDAPGNAAPADPVIAAAGDIACAPPATTPRAAQQLRYALLPRDQPVRTTQRKPRWEVPVSTAWAMRAAGR